MKTLASGHKVEEIVGEELKDQQKKFKLNQSGVVRIQPGRWFLLASYVKYADQIYNFKSRPDDVYIMTYPKVGTTWTQEVVWTMRNNTNLDNKAADDPVLKRSPFIDSDMLLEAPDRSGPLEYMRKPLLKNHPDLDFSKGVTLQIADKLPSPRTIKTHLPFSLMGKNLLDESKVIYVVRNPKDVVVSFLHHHRLFALHGYEGTDEEFVRYFMDGNLLYGCYFEHLKEVVERMGHKNLHILYFENMKKDPIAEIRKLDTFLGTSLTDEQVKNIAKYTSFEEMKKRDNLVTEEEKEGMYNEEVLKKDGGFFRKGESGNYKKKLPEDVQKKLNEWIEMKCKQMNIPFKDLWL